MITTHRAWMRWGIVPLIVLLSAAVGANTWAKPSGASLPFSNDLDLALARGRSERKPVVVAFVAAWCPVCVEMKKSVFRDPKILAVSDEFIWVMVDIDRQLSVAREQLVEGVPLLKVFDADGAPRDSILGLLEAEPLVDRLQSVLKGEPIPADSGERARSDLTWKPAGYRGSGVCFSHVGYGPLKLHSQSPFQSLRLVMRPRTPSTLGKGQYEASGSTTWVSVWGIDKAVGDPSNEFVLDFEMLQVKFSLAYGISDTLEFEAEIQDRSRFGGVMDGFTQGFHDLFGVDQNGRDEVPRGEFVIQLNPPGGSAVALGNRDRGSFSRTVQLSLQHNISCGTRRLPALSYSVSARLEMLDVDMAGGSDLDLSASMALARRMGRFYMYGTLGYAWFGRDNFRGLELEQTQLSVLFTLEWRFHARQALLVQYLRSDGLFEAIGAFSDTSNEITLGYKWELRPKGILELGLIENIGTFDNSPDFGVHVGFSQRF